MKFYRHFLSLVLFLFLGNLLIATPQKDTGSITPKLVYKFDIKQQIGPAAWRQTQQAFEEAKQAEADYILIHMNTYGGLVVSADSIRSTILNTPTPVMVFIDNNAASAGALISIACDSIYMRSGANMGAATVVNQTGQAMPDKYQSYMRSTMRATAEAHGKDTLIQNGDTIIKWKRDPLIAEAMVDPRTYIEGIIDTGQVLTFTPDEAMRHGYCEGVARNVEEVLKIAGIENYTIQQYEPTPLEKLIGFMLNPVLQGLLIMIIVGGIYFELQTPGVGFPLIAAITAAVLYFSPLYLEGLAANWEIILFVLGVVLLGVEIFVIPGFGIAGFAGITLIVFGLTLSLVDNVVFEFEPRHIKLLLSAFLLVVVSMMMSLVGSIYVSKKLFTTTTFGHLALDSVAKSEEGYIGVDVKARDLVGSTGISHSVLRPSGKVEIDGEIYDAKAELGFIDKGETVRVIRYETGQVYVIKEENENGTNQA
ncbi:MAG: nodulation protein NfeD [Marinifilaceae bacterium]